MHDRSIVPGCMTGPVGQGRSPFVHCVGIRPEMQKG